jgi:hypothetical protein
MKRWPLWGGAHPLGGPAESSPGDISTLGRVVGFTHSTAAVNPGRPWTLNQGSTTWLPVPNLGTLYGVVNISVNRCGTIVGTLAYYNSGGTLEKRGIRWTKPTCDLDGIFIGGAAR